ncbi:MAG: gliding motility-associated C-terminal domain-containing protein [Bacteroidota bacterium]
MNSSHRKIFYKIIILFSFLLTSSQSNAQAEFTLPDTVCVNELFTITNTSVGGTTFSWNFCSASINFAPSGTNMGNLGSLDKPVFIDIAKDGTDYYGFATNLNTGTITRLFFGPDLLSNPVAVNLGSLGGVIPYQVEGIDIEFDAGNWYGIVVGDQSTPEIIRLSFGTSLANVPTAVSMGNIGTLSYPVDVYVFKNGADWHGLTVNADNYTVTRFDFGSSLANTPTGVNLGNIGGLVAPVGICPIVDNGNWYLFVTNRDNNTISRLDFGSSLLNIPVGTNLGNINGTFNMPRDITIVRDCNQIFGLVVNQNSDDIVRLDFTSGITGVPNATSLGNIAGFDFPHSISPIVRVDDTLVSFTTNVNNNTISRLYYTGCTNASTNYSTLQNPPPISYNTTGVYNISLTVDEGLPGWNSVCHSITVIAGGLPVNAASNSPVCSGDSVHLFETTNAYSSYTWSGPNGFNSALQNPSVPNAVVANQGWYIVSASGSVCGSARDSVYVTVNPSPTVPVFSNVTGTSCNLSNGSATATSGGGTAPYTYTWNTTPVQTGQTVSNLPGGNYTVTVSDANGCSASNSVTITTSAGITLSITTIDATCNQGGAATAVVSGNPLEYSYVWSNGETTQTITNLPAGSYSVTVSLLSCSNTATAQISASAGPQAAVSWTPSYITVDEPDVSFHDQSSGNPVSWQWTWDNGSTSTLQNPINSFNTAGTYSGMLIVTDINGCSDTAYFTIVVNDASTFYIPNTFTPDADGINDYFGPSGIGIDPDNFEFYIYNRWGEELFHSTSINHRWNGTYKGELVQQGVYVWLVIYKQLGFDKKLKEAGHVNVIK